MYAEELIVSVAFSVIDRGASIHRVVRRAFFPFFKNRCFPFLYVPLVVLNHDVYRLLELIFIFVFLLNLPQM